VKVEDNLEMSDDIDFQFEGDDDDNDNDKPQPKKPDIPAVKVSDSKSTPTKVEDNFEMSDDDDIDLQFEADDDKPLSKKEEPPKKLAAKPPSLKKNTTNLDLSNSEGTMSGDFEDFEADPPPKGQVKQDEVEDINVDIELPDESPSRAAHTESDDSFGDIKFDSDSGF
jgi:hypothetical protein